MCKSILSPSFVWNTFRFSISSGTKKCFRGEEKKKILLIEIILENKICSNLLSLFISTIKRNIFFFCVLCYILSFAHHLKVFKVLESILVWNCRLCFHLRRIIQNKTTCNHENKFLKRWSFFKNFIYIVKFLRWTIHKMNVLRTVWFEWLQNFCWNHVYFPRLVLAS
jgi:hypothetical protein